METKSERLLRLPEVLQRVGIGRSTLYRLIADKKFDAPVAVTERCRAWPESRVNDWISARCDSVEQREPK